VSASRESVAPAPDTRLALGFVVLCGGALLALIVAGTADESSRWAFVNRCDGRDAVTYYYAAIAAQHGIDPYDLHAISSQYGAEALFVYPAFALPLFYPLTPFEPAVALLVFAGLRLICVAGLLALSTRLLPVPWWAHLAFFPVGFGATAVHDLCSANVVAFEALALWLGIAALWRGKAVGFPAWIAVAAAPKLLWLALPPLALRGSSSLRPRAAVVVGLFATLFAVWFGVWPESVLAWFANARLTTTFRYNVFTLSRGIVDMLGGDVTGSYIMRIEAWGYLLWIALVGAVLLAAWRAGTGLRALSLLALVSLLAVWPGNLSYSWLPLLPAAVAAIFFFATRGQIGLALALTALCVWPQPLLEWLGPGNTMGQGTFASVLFVWAALAIIVRRWPQEFEIWLGGRMHGAD